MASAPQTNAVRPFWDEPLAALYQEAEATTAGLTVQEAERRLGEVGPNELARHGPRTAIELLLFFTNPLVVILLFAALVSGFLGEYFNAGLISTMVVVSVALNFFQAYRSQHAAESLRRTVVSTAIVLRAGIWQEIARADVVPGDVFRLSAGDLVPADGRLIEAHDLFTDEAALTGESLPAEKRAVPEAATSTELMDADGAVFFGTSVVSGTATALVVHTGRATELGRIARHLTQRPAETEFERGTRGFGVLIMRTVIVLTLFVFIVNGFIRHLPLLDSFLFAIALAVGLTPEFLPMIMSVTLANGALKMSRKKVIVKRLASIENFGSMNVLCSDKTGTLTEGRISLERYVNFDGEQDDRVLLFAALNGAFETGIKSPLDDAIVAHQHPDISSYAKVDEIPFDFERRRSSIVVERGEDRLLVTKGAPEHVLPLCTHYETGGRVRLCTGDVCTRAAQTFDQLSAGGYRVLAVAHRLVDSRPAYTTADEAGLTLVGFAAFLDPPRESAAQTLEMLRRQGITVKILTGDNELVTRAICDQVGMKDVEIVLGRQIDATSDDALSALAERATVFARVSPDQKNRLIHALHRRGHVVGYMGDGINDAPSLHNADVGISVAGAVDVAKEAADIILLEHSLAVLHDGVVEGRKSFGNIMKYIMMGTSSNFGNMFSMAGASLFLPFLPMLPIQILLNNLLYDLSQLTIPGDRVDDDYLQNPKRWNIGFIQKFMLIIGPISSAYDFLTFGAMLLIFHASEQLFHTGWFVESLATQTLVILVIRTSARPWQSRPSRPLLASIVAAVLVGIVIPYTPAGSWLKLAPLPLAFFGFLIAAVVTYLALVELVKHWFFRRYAV